MTHLVTLLLGNLLLGLFGGSVMLLVEAFDPRRSAARQSTEAVTSIRRHRHTIFPAVDHD